MTVTELRHSLDLLDVKAKQYSLNGEQKPDSIIIDGAYNIWTVLYLDQHGAAHNERTFESEESACDHMYDLFRKMKNIETEFSFRQ